jgi:hypothetical protein
VKSLIEITYVCRDHSDISCRSPIFISHTQLHLKPSSFLKNPAPGRECPIIRVCDRKRPLQPNNCASVLWRVIQQRQYQSLTLARTYGPEIKIGSILSLCTVTQHGLRLPQSLRSQVALNLAKLIGPVCVCQEPRSVAWEAECPLSTAR